MKTLLLILGLLLSSHINPDKIRYGDYHTFDSSKNHLVGVVKSVDVYEHIPEYKTIQKEKVKKGTARYTQLMLTCTKKFRGSLSKVAATYSYKLIVEIGGVSDYPTTDVTKLVINGL